MTDKNKHTMLYTDGSCNTKFRTGAWVAIIFIDGQKNILQGIEHDTTHQRMELRGIIESMKWLIQHHPDKSDVHLFTDSQYVVNLPARKAKLVNQRFTTSKKELISNADLIEEFYKVIGCFQLQIEKVKAHEKKRDDVYNGNREADRLCRKAVRNELNN